MFKKKILSAVIVACGLAWVGCGEPSWPPPDIKKMMAEIDGRVKICGEKLAAGDYPAARNAAQFVVNTPRLATFDYVGVDRARFCYTTANTLHIVNETTKQLETLLTILLGLFGGEFSLAPHEIERLAAGYLAGGFEPMRQSPLGILIDSVTGPFRNALKDNRVQLEAIIKKNRFRWSIMRLPVKIGDREVADAGGIYDMGEVQILYGVTELLLGGFSVIESHDYTLDISALAEYALSPTSPVQLISTRPGTAVANLYATLLGTSPVFLTLDANGKEAMQNAGASFSAGLQGFLSGVDSMKKRKGDQSVNVLEYREGDSGKSYVVVNLNFEQGSDPIPFVDLGGFQGIAVPIRDDILQSIERIRNDFAGVTGENTNLQRDVFPLLALAVSVVVQSGALDAIIDLALQGADPSTRKIATEVLGLLKSNQDLIVGGLVALVPVEIEFDFGTLVAQPVSLRDVLPAWTQPPGKPDVKAFADATLVYSYECEDGSDPLRDDTYLCAKAVDGSHFRRADGDVYQLWDPAAGEPTDTTLRWENNLATGNFGQLWNGFELPMPVDGLASPAPYLAFKDPTFGGVLFLDMAVIADTVPNTVAGLEPATLRTLNATIANSVATVSGLLR